MQIRHRRPDSTPRKHYTINTYITAPELRVIDGEGKQIGVMSTQQALSLAREREEDLILITSHATPPVAKMIDFKKFLYQEGKKLKEAKKGVKKSIVKDIKLSLFVAPNDLDRFENKAKEFLEEGNQIRINLTLKGRELGKKPMAIELVKKFITSLGEVNISKEPRIEGRVVRAVVSRKK